MASAVLRTSSSTFTALHKMRRSFVEDFLAFDQIINNASKLYYMSPRGMSVVFGWKATAVILPDLSLTGVSALSQCSFSLN